MRIVSSEFHKEYVTLPIDVCDADLFSRRGIFFLLAKSSKKQRGRFSTLVISSRSFSDIGKLFVPAISCFGNHRWYINRNRFFTSWLLISFGLLNATSSFSQFDSSVAPMFSSRKTGTGLFYRSLVKTQAVRTVTNTILLGTKRPILWTELRAALLTRVVPGSRVFRQKTSQSRSIMHLFTRVGQDFFCTGAGGVPLSW
jgi:hypothetical protein